MTIRAVVRMGDGVAVGELVELTAEEQAEHDRVAAEDAIREAARIIAEKRKRLLDHARNEAIENMITARKNAIDNMNEAALDAELQALGLGGL